MDKKLIEAKFILINLVCFGWIFAIPVMVFYLEDLFGYESFFLFSLISTIFSLLLNIKFGQWLDKYGSKNILTIGLFFNLIFWLIMSLSENYWIIMFGFIVEGISISALMIARAPYFYEVVKSKLKHDRYEDIESKIKSAMLIVSVFCLLSSGYLYSVNNVLPFVINALLVFTLILTICSNKFKSPRKTDNIKIGKEESLMGGFKIVFTKKKRIFYLASAEGIFTALTAYLFFFVSIYLISIGASVIFVSYLISVVYVFRSLGSYLIKIKHSYYLVFYFFILFLLLFVLIPLSKNIWIVSVIFLIVSVLKEYIEVYLTIEVTKQSPDNLRGFIRSYSEVVSNSSIILLMMFSYFSANLIEENILMLSYCFLFFLCFLLVYKYFKRTIEIKKALI